MVNFEIKDIPLISAGERRFHLCRAYGCDRAIAAFGLTRRNRRRNAQQSVMELSPDGAKAKIRTGNQTVFSGSRERPAFLKRIKRFMR
ncbi:MAG: hypothetical protein LBK58_08720 [Prevotellaceae bacterium]|nr:hypothetical protein [Prevotellaceae bacterium]